MTTEYVHPVQKKLLNILAKNIEEPLTIREMQDLVGASSTSVVVHHLAQLEKKGFLKKNPYNPRDYQILKQQDKEAVHINLYGLATCGPNGSILEGNPIDRIVISTKLLSFSSSKAFMVKARGDSMLPKISNGDFVIAQKSSEAENGEIVVCVNDGKALIKKYKRESGRSKIILTSLNSDYEAFLASEKDFRIEGIVKGVLSNKIL